MRTSILAVILVAGTAAAFPAIAQQAAPSEQSQKMQGGDADKAMKGGPDAQMQQEADKGAKTKNSGDSGFVADQNKPGNSASPPGRPMETTGEKK